MMAVGLLVLIYSIKLVIGKQEGFIVGGAYVESIRTFPHVAFLTLQVADSEDEFICGSSILNQWILLTAAHCFDDASKALASVGNVDRDKGRMYRVKSYKQHEKWDTLRVNHDIAMCKLKKALALGGAVKRVVLMRHPPRARIADLAGWGATEEKEFVESVLLKHTKQKMWTYQECKKIIHHIPKGTICGGEKRARGNFASKGDSGSGLLVHSKIIVGLVSYKDLSVSRSLVVYTDVLYFYDWIVRISKKLRCFNG